MAVITHFSPEPTMNSENLSPLQFLSQISLAAGALAVAGTTGRVLAQAAPAAPAASAAVPAAAAAAVKLTASDIVELGKTGLKCSRLGLGLGSNNGQVQIAQGA